MDCNNKDCDVKKVKQAQLGDKAALVDLVMKRKDQLYRISWSYLQNEPDTRDALQDTIIKAFHDIAGLRNPEYFYTWYIRILINTCKQNMLNRRKVINLDAVKEYAAGEKDMCSEDSIDLEAGMRQLTQEYKEVIYMHYAEDLPIKDIAAILGIPEGTVKSRLHYGVVKLREFVGERQVGKYGM